MPVQANEPGWEEPTESASIRPFQSMSQAEKEQARSGAAEYLKSQDSNRRRRDGKSDSNRGDSSQFSSGDNDGKEERPTPQVLASLVGEGLQMLSSAATLFTRKRFGLQLRLTESEAKKIGDPIARFVGRRFNISGDLNDANDAAGTLSGFLKYLERIFAGDQTVDVTSTQSQPARPPAPTSELLNDDATRVRSDSRSREPGSGQMRDQFFSDYAD